MKEPYEDKLDNDKEEVKKILDQIKPAIEEATSKQLFETCNDLASNPELREKVEKEIQATLPEGSSFRINEAGFGEMKLPLHISKYVSNPDEEQEEQESEDDSPYCPECGACGHDGCCPALMCAYHNMVEKGHGEYCEGYYWDLVVAYEVLNKLNDKQLDEIGYNEILDKVYKDRESHNRKIEPWMTLTKQEIIRLEEDDWKHYKDGGCLCSAHGDCECICGSWSKEKF